MTEPCNSTSLQSPRGSYFMQETEKEKSCWEHIKICAYSFFQCTISPFIALWNLFICKSCRKVDDSTADKDPPIIFPEFPTPQGPNGSVGGEEDPTLNIGSQSSAEEEGDGPGLSPRGAPSHISIRSSLPSVDESSRKAEEENASLRCKINELNEKLIKQLEETVSLQNRLLKNRVSDSESFVAPAASSSTCSTSGFGPNSGSGGTS